MQLRSGFVKETKTSFQTFMFSVLGNRYSYAKDLFDPSYVTDEQSDCILFAAIHCNNYLMVKFLLDKGFNPNVKNNLGQTTLARTNNIKISELLIKYGAN